MEPRKDVIIWDRESRKKCSIYPLKPRESLLFIHSDRILDGRIEESAFDGCLFLHPDGSPLSVDDQCPLLLLDASWKRAGRLASQPPLARLTRRSLRNFATAYPRKSRTYEMPPAGLASVEALYVAYLMQGREDPTLLDHYHWRQEFLEANREAFEKCRRSILLDKRFEKS